MKQFILLIALCISLIVGGCTPSGALPGVSPTANVAVSTFSVEYSEKVLASAKDTLVLFLSLDDMNRPLVKEKLPQVHAFAEKLRKNDYAVNLLQRANNAKNTFKHNRTADNQANLNTLMQTVFALQADMNANITKIQKAKP